MFFGSKTADTPVKTPIAANFDNANFTVTADQVTETYTVANIASALSLPSSQTISENYVTINSIYETTGTTSTSSSQVVEKPTVIDTSNLQRGIVTYIVQDGDTFLSIYNAHNYGETKDQLRWSNGLKKEEVTSGSTLYIPTLPGIVYKVKSGDTLDSISTKTGSPKDEIISYNDLEDRDISTDSLLLLPKGTLPEKERPEYVAPTPRPSYNSGNTYSYVRDTADRHGRFEIGNYSYWSNMYYSTRWQNNPGAFGNCTWFVWYMRYKMGGGYVLPTGAIGNARSWVSSLSGSYWTGRTPAYGAIMQSTSGTYGHVAIVIGVVEGQYITIQEMNYQGYNRVFQSTISWSDALKYNYIYQHK